MMKALEGIRQLIKEEQAQVSIEYYLLVGAAILAAVMAASSYRKMAYGNLMRYNESIQATYDTLCSYIAPYLDVDVSEFCP